MNFWQILDFHSLNFAGRFPKWQYFKQKQLYDITHYASIILIKVAIIIKFETINLIIKL